jgi:hypothetical protein
MICTNAWIVIILKKLVIEINIGREFDGLGDY